MKFETMRTGKGEEVEEHQDSEEERLDGKTGKLDWKEEE
jgi:hypothetical protein